MWSGIIFLALERMNEWVSKWINVNLSCKSEYTLYLAML